MRQVVAFSLALLISTVAAAQNKPGVYTDPNNADADFAVQGEYVGEAAGKPVGAQVIARGNGKFEVVLHVGGLPGAGWKKGDPREVAQGETKDGKVTFKLKEGEATLANGQLTLPGGKLKKTKRKSPTLGAKPPQGAVVLFDGSTPENFKGGKMTDDGLLMQGVTSKHLYQSAKLHIEFRLPYQPTAKGQGRGNSGAYLQGRYEVQMLDSFGLDGKHNECGGIYSIKEPDVNMCLPPLTWQTYDIDYTAAEFKDGKKVKDSHITVRHNGVVIHDNVALPKSTTAAPVKEGPDPGPLYLQNHGNPVRYRNIWLVEKK